MTGTSQVNYSRLDRALHKLAFSNLEIQKSLADIEDRMHAKRFGSIAIEKPVFITALPRAGTTLMLDVLARNPGTFANTVLQARRMVERGVRFVQIYHNNWDTHANVAGRLPDQCRDVDQACWGLVQDLKNKGLFESTLIIWGGEFGRTIYSQGGLTAQNYGRDHHPRCFTMWMAGGGARGGQIYGTTDDFSYNIVEDPCHIRDFHATVLQLLGFDHERFTHRYLGLDQRLTGVEQAQVVKELLA